MTDATDATPYVAAILGVFFVVFLLVALLSVASYVALALTLSLFFRKVGVEPWIAWVPFYNYWKWLEVGGQPGWISLLSLVPFGSYATVVFLAIGNYRSGIAFGKDGSWVVLSIFLPWVWLYLLSREGEVYDPRRITAAGHSGRLAGYGAA